MMQVLLGEMAKRVFEEIKNNLDSFYLIMGVEQGKFSDYEVYDFYSIYEYKVERPQNFSLIYVNDSVKRIQLEVKTSASMRERLKDEHGDDWEIFYYKREKHVKEIAVEQKIEEELAKSHIVELRKIDGTIRIICNFS
jgi:hypothetical protein